jgi:5,6-dimethylbenzimidazole synthase
MTYEELLELLKYRRSIRKFKPDAIPDEYVMKILDAAHYSMSGANSQPWEFIVIRNEETKERIHSAYLKFHREYVWYIEQQRIPELRHPALNVGPDQNGKTNAMLAAWKDAPIYIAVLGDPRKQWGSVLLAQQTGKMLCASLSHCTSIIHLAAASLGLGSQRVDITVQQPFREILKYPEPLNLDVLIPIGFRAYEPGPPRRLPLEELIHHDQYDMSKYLRNEDFLKYLMRIRSLGEQGYKAVIAPEENK